MTKKDIINSVIGIEGGYSYHPKDTGGETMYGITERVAKRHGYTGPMKYLPYEKAIDIYTVDYWDKMSLKPVLSLSEGIAYELFEQGINIGVHRASVNLQKTLNAFSNNGKHYKFIVVDGKIGRQTIGTLSFYINKRGDNGVVAMVNALNSLQGAYYLNITKSKPEVYGEFVYGWMLNRVKY